MHTFQPDRAEVDVSPQLLLVLYVVIPLWLLAGLADWACHRRSDLKDTSGAPESVLHLLLLLEMGLPLLGALYLEVNALILGVLVVALCAHEATAYLDVCYAAPRRRVGVAEQFVHSVLEMCPLMLLLLLASAHWEQWLALWGMGAEAARLDLAPSALPPSPAYTAALVVAVTGFALGPYVEELLRARRAARRPPQHG